LIQKAFLIWTYVDGMPFNLIDQDNNTGCPKKNATPIFLYISVRINATVLCFISAVVGCPPECFAYRHRSERWAVPEIFWFRYWLSNPMQNHFVSCEQWREVWGETSWITWELRNRGSDQKTDFCTLTSNILSSYLMDYQKEIDRFVRWINSY
jgi:hypothetical protein